MFQPASGTGCTRLMDSVDRTMQSVLARDEEDRSRLQEQRDSVRGGLSELDAGRRARHGYQATPQTGETHRFADAPRMT